MSPCVTTPARMCAAQGAKKKKRAAAAEARGYVRISITSPWQPALLTSNRREAGEEGRGAMGGTEAWRRSDECN